MKLTDFLALKPMTVVSGIEMASRKPRLDRWYGKSKLFEVGYCEVPLFLGDKFYNFIVNPGESNLFVEPEINFMMRFPGTRKRASNFYNLKLVLENEVEVVYTEIGSDKPDKRFFIYNDLPNYTTQTFQTGQVFGTLLGEVFMKKEQGQFKVFPKMLSLINGRMVYWWPQFNVGLDQELRIE